MERDAVVGGDATRSEGRDDGGSSGGREWDPATARQRTRMETLDPEGRVRIVRPESADGEKLHYLFDEYGLFDENGNFLETF